MIQWILVAWMHNAQPITLGPFVDKSKCLVAAEELLAPKEVDVGVHRINSRMDGARCIAVEIAEARNK